MLPSTQASILLGNIDVMDFSLDGRAYAGVVIMSLYVFVMVLVMLNLLISIGPSPPQSALSPTQVPPEPQLKT